MGPRRRKLWLTVHVSVSVGWLGAVVAFLAFLALAVAAPPSDDPDLVRGAYLTMDGTGWWVLVPLSVACLLAGVVQSLGTHWGLLRHYWVLATLVINLTATVVLVPFMGGGCAAGAAACDQPLGGKATGVDPPWPAPGG